MPPTDVNRIAFSIRVVDDERRVLTSGGADGDETCHICRETFCDDDQCVRTMTSLACCTQTLCCGCATKMAMRCTCTEDCTAVIAYCPFCRQVSPLSTLDIFLGHTKPCKDCEPPAAPTPAVVGNATAATTTTSTAAGTESEYETDEDSAPAAEAVEAAVEAATQTGADGATPPGATGSG